MTGTDDRPIEARQGLRSVLRALDHLNSAVKVAIGGLLAVATIAIAVQVLVRFVLSTMGLNVSAPWTEELARYAMIWSVFLGVGVLSRDAALISVEMIPQLAPRRIGLPLRLLAIGITAIFFIYLAYEGYWFTLEGAWETSPVLRLEMTWVHLAFPVGAGLAVINLVAFIVECLALGRDAVLVEDLDTLLE